MESARSVAASHELEGWMPIFSSSPRTGRAEGWCCRYYGPHPKVKAETGLMPKRKRMEEVAETSKRPWPGGAGKPGSGSSEDEQDVPQWPGLGGTRYSHDGRVIRPGMMPPGMPPMFGMPTGVLPPYGMENPQAAAAAAAAMFQTRGGWPIPPFPPYCPPFHSGEHSCMQEEKGLRSSSEPIVLNAAM